MKKTLITLLALGGLAMGEDLTMSADAVANNDQKNDAYSVTNGVASLKKGNIALTWVGSDTQLTSWELSFTLNDKTIITGSGYSNLFGTLTKGGGGAIGYVLRVNSAGALELTNTDIVTTNGLITAGTDVAITLRFVANEEANQSLTGGVFTLMVGESEWSDTVTFGSTIDGNCDSLTNYCTSLQNGRSNEYTYTETNKVTGELEEKTAKYGSHMWTNGGEEELTNISVTRLANNVVPEPATATLSLLALAGLAMRRRRK